MCLYRDVIPAKVTVVDGQFCELKTTDERELNFTVHKSMLPFRNPQKGSKVGLRLTKLGNEITVKKCLILGESQQDKHIPGELIAGEVVEVNSREVKISTFDGGQERIAIGFPQRDNQCPKLFPGDAVFAEITEKKGQLIASAIRTKPVFVNGTKRETTGRVPSRR